MAPLAHISSFATTTSRSTHNGKTPTPAHHHQPLSAKTPTPTDKIDPYKRPLSRLSAAYQNIPALDHAQPVGAGTREESPAEIYQTTWPPKVHPY